MKDSAREHRQRWLRHFLPLCALLFSLAAPTLVEASGGHAGSGGHGVTRPGSVSGGRTTGGGIIFPTPTPMPTLAPAAPPSARVVGGNATTPSGIPSPAARQAGIVNGAPAPANDDNAAGVPGDGNSADSTASASSLSTNSAQLVGLVVVLVLIAGSIVAVAGLLALCALVQRHDRSRLRGAG